MPPSYAQCVGYAKQVTEKAALALHVEHLSFLFKGTEEQKQVVAYQVLKNMVEGIKSKPESLLGPGDPQMAMLEGDEVEAWYKEHGEQVEQEMRVARVMQVMPWHLDTAMAKLLDALWAEKDMVLLPGMAEFLEAEFLETMLGPEEGVSSEEERAAVEKLLKKTRPAAWAKEVDQYLEVQLGCVDGQPFMCEQRDQALKAAESEWLRTAELAPSISAPAAPKQRRPDVGVEPRKRPAPATMLYQRTGSGVGAYALPAAMPGARARMRSKSPGPGLSRRRAQPPPGAVEVVEAPPPPSLASTPEAMGAAANLVTMQTILDASALTTAGLVERLKEWEQPNALQTYKLEDRSLLILRYMSLRAVKDEQSSEFSKLRPDVRMAVNVHLWMLARHINRAYFARLFALPGQRFAGDPARSPLVMFESMGLDLMAFVAISSTTYYNHLTQPQQQNIPLAEAAAVMLVNVAVFAYMGVALGQSWNDVARHSLKWVTVAATGLVASQMWKLVGMEGQSEVQAPVPMGETVKNAMALVLPAPVMSVVGSVLNMVPRDAWTTLLVASGGTLANVVGKKFSAPASEEGGKPASETLLKTLFSKSTALTLGQQALPALFNVSELYDWTFDDINVPLAGIKFPGFTTVDRAVQTLVIHRISGAPGMVAENMVKAAALREKLKTIKNSARRQAFLVQYPEAAKTPELRISVMQFMIMLTAWTHFLGNVKNLVAAPQTAALVGLIQPDSSPWARAFFEIFPGGFPVAHWLRRALVKMQSVSFSEDRWFHSTANVSVFDMPEMQDLRRLAELIRLRAPAYQMLEYFQGLLGSQALETLGAKDMKEGWFIGFCLPAPRVEENLPGATLKLAPRALQVAVLVNDGREVVQTSPVQTTTWRDVNGDETQVIVYYDGAFANKADLPVFCVYRILESM